jgi:hypothetical protein
MTFVVIPAHIAGLFERREPWGAGCSIGSKLVR